MKLIDFPKLIPKLDYQSLIGEIIGVLDDSDVALSVYQMGSVKDPGISDLDLICVFKEDATFYNNLRVSLNSHQKTILTHGIFGCNKNNINQAIDYGYFSNLTHLYGKNLNLEKKDRHVDKEIETQIALEYLVKMFITIDSQITFGIVKLRSFLLLVKALKFDLDILNITQGNLFDKVIQVLEWRRNWFTKTPSNDELKLFILQFHKDLKQELDTILKTETFFLPTEKIEFSRSFRFIRDKTFFRKRKGVLLPENLCFMSKKYINIQLRLNKFSYHIPYLIPLENSIIAQRFAFYKDYLLYNKQYYPNFQPLTSSLIVV